MLLGVYGVCMYVCVCMCIYYACMHNIHVQVGRWVGRCPYVYSQVIRSFFEALVLTLKGFACTGLEHLCCT